MPFERILVPTDGSTCAEAAVSYAADLASRYGAAVDVLCVVDARTLDNVPHRERETEASGAVAREIAAELTDQGLTVTDAVRTGVPHEEILGYADEEDIDLIAMGTHGRTGVERYILGSVTEKVVRLSSIPVLTVHATQESTPTFPYTDILLPTDGSDVATDAVDVGLDIAVTYGARVHALSVVETVVLGADATGDVFDTIEEVARDAVEAVADRAERAGVDAIETAVEFGHPYRAIRQYTDEHDIDLVVMGTHGRSGIERYLLGSVTEKTLRTSTVPVLTVRPPAEE